MTRDPFRELFAFAPGFTQVLEASRQGAAGSWLPPLDVYETKDAYVVVIDVPGVSLDRLDVMLENGVLTVRGERKFHPCVSEESFHRVERRFGQFTRSVSLPSSRVESDGVTARSSDGVLTIEVPKAAAAQPRRITVVDTSTSIEAEGPTSASVAPNGDTPFAPKEAK